MITRSPLGGEAHVGSQKQVSVTVSKDGPYMVSGGASLICGLSRGPKCETKMEPTNQLEVQSMHGLMIVGQLRSPIFAG